MLPGNTGTHCKMCPLSERPAGRMTELGLYIPSPVSNSWRLTFREHFREHLSLGNSGVLYVQAEQNQRPDKFLSFVNTCRFGELKFLECPEIVRPEWLWLQCRHRLHQQGNKCGSCQQLEIIKCCETGLDP